MVVKTSEWAGKRVERKKMLKKKREKDGGKKTGPWEVRERKKDQSYFRISAFEWTERRK